MMGTAMRSDWVEVELGNVCNVNMGQSPPSSTYNRDGIGLPFFQGKAEFAEVHPVVEKWCDAPKKTASKNDVLISVRAPVGATNIAIEKCAIGRGLATISYCHCYKYLFYYLRLIETQLDKIGTGTTFKAISGSVLKSLNIPFAPVPEQRALVAKIDQLFSRLDHGIASLKAAQEKLTLYRQAVLKRAIEGELTREWREQQTNLSVPNELLTQIKTELYDYQQQQLQEWQVAIKVWKAAGEEGKKPARPKKYKVITELTKEDLSELPELPNEWCWQKLGSICQKLQIGPFGSQMHKHEYVEEGVPVVNPQHIKSQKIFPQIFISEQKAKSLRQYVLEENDIILGRRGEMGRSACISAKEQGWFCGSGSLFIRLGSRFNGLLYSLILSERRVVHYLEEKGSGTTMTNLNSTILSELPIQLIPLEEQAQIAKEIETRFSVCDHLQQEIERGLQKAEALRQSVLKKAFEGRLLTEIELADCRAAPDWEPAQQLLAKIQVEKRAKQENQLSQ